VSDIGNAGGDGNVLSGIGNAGEKGCIWCRDVRDVSDVDEASKPETMTVNAGIIEKSDVRFINI
jgi:hypothetical protein